MSTTASTCSTSRCGSSSAVSRLAGAPPRTSPDATVPSGTVTTVTPVPSPVQWPTPMPGTSVIRRRPPAGRARRGRAEQRAAGPEPPQRRAGAEVACELRDERVDLVGALEHEHVAGALEHLESRVGDELGDAPRLRRRGDDVRAPAEHERGHPDLGQLVGHVEADERGHGLLARRLRARRDHLPDELDVTRLRVASEADAGEEEAEVLLGHQLVGRRPAAGEALEHLAQPARAGQVRLRKSRHQHHAADALGGDLGVVRRERLQRDAAHRVADEHGVVQVHALEHGPHVLGEVLDRVTAESPHSESPWPRWSNPMQRNPCSGSVSNCFTQTRVESVTPCEKRIGGPLPRPIV